MEKKCNSCNLVLDISNFYKKGKYKEDIAYTSLCKICQKKKYHEPNRERLNEYQKRYRSENRDKYLESKSKSKIKNKENIREYFLKNKDSIYKRINIWRKNKIENDEMYKIKDSIRKTISSAFRRMSQNKESKFSDIIGCSIDDFKSHIENQFRDGMNWDNYGYRGWHFDHIIPTCSANSYEELLALNHYTNIQPLWSHENFKKSGKY
jgi:hypothetical protein